VKDENEEEELEFLSLPFHCDQDNSDSVAPISWPVGRLFCAGEGRVFRQEIDYGFDQS